jgi:hypothetical protein
VHQEANLKTSLDPNFRNSLGTNVCPAFDGKHLLAALVVEVARAQTRQTTPSAAMAWLLGRTIALRGTHITPRMSR